VPRGQAASLTVGLGPLRDARWPRPLRRRAPPHRRL